MHKAVRIGPDGEIPVGDVQVLAALYDCPLDELVRRLAEWGVSGGVSTIQA